MTVKGWMRRGPDFTQNFQGWKVYAERQSEEDIPVTLTVGHATTEEDNGNVPEGAVGSSRG